MIKINFGDINKVILFGGGLLLRDVAKQLGNSGYEVVVFSAPRHLKEQWEGKTLKEFLIKNGIDFYEVEDINSNEQVLSSISDKTLGLSLGAAWIFKEKLIQLFNGRLINLHGTRLPQNRGGGGFSWQILRKNKLGNCLVHQVFPGIDNGDIVKYKEFVYPESCQIPQDFINYYNQKNIIFIEEFMSQIKAKKDFKVVGQPEYLSMYWSRLNTEKHAFIDWSWSLEHVETFINAFDAPYVGAATFINGQKVFLKGCQVDYNDGSFHPFQQGIIYRKMEDKILVSVNEGTLIINKVLNEDGKGVRDELRLGERFYTPLKYLEQAKLFKAVYTSTGLKDEIFCPPLEEDIDGKISKII